MRVCGIADDLTGALEVGALLGAQVQFHGEFSSCDAAVIDIESRHMTADDAARAIRNVGPACRRAGIVYKKTDSTLRGNIGAELQAITEVLDGAPVAYIPAYPAMGRTVRYGRLYVHGDPVEATQFARDSLNPVKNGAIRDLLHRLTKCKIFDAEREEHVKGAVQSALRDRFRILAGPASVARALAVELDLRSELSQLPRAQTCWVVNGSLHDVSALQVRAAREAGLFGDGWQELTPPFMRVGPFIADRLAAGTPEALIVFGGDTAFAIVSALGCPTLHPLCELLPGVPASRMENRPTILITKAGGFGDQNLLQQLKATLQ